MCRMVVVSCKSKYAHTKTYAQWIAEEFGADLIESCNVNTEKLLDYDIIVYGGGIFNHSIEGISAITNNFNLLKDKTIVVFTVGMECSTSNSELVLFIDKIFTEEMKSKIHLFHLKGEIDQIKTSFIHKQLSGISRKLRSFRYTDANRNEILENNEPIILSSYGNVIDFIDKRTINPELIN